MQNLAYADAVRPSPVVVLKLPMRPYSLGHEVLLLAQRNPLVEVGREKMEDGNEQRAAIIRAALVCSNDWEQNKQPQRWMRLWGWMIRNESFPLAIADFQNYRLAGSTFPFISDLQSEDKGRPLGSPLLSRLLNFVDGDFDYPLGLAQWQYFSHLEDEGRIHVENDYEQQVREEIAQVNADIAREKAEKKGGG